MLSYLLKIFALIIFSFFIIFNFYFVFPWHIENYDWYFSYVFIIWILYWIYKYFQLQKSTDIALISLKNIIYFFLLNLLILCFYFFNSNNFPISWWIELFFKIFMFSLLPITIFIISLSFGKKILLKLPNKQDFWSWIFWMLELIIWFISFITLVVIFWLLNLYNLYIVFLILSWFLVYSYKELSSIIKSIFNYNFTFDIKEWNYMKLLSTEFFSIFSFIVLWVGLISIIRPFPVWWDDLWVYMNYPHLMAEAGNLLSLWAMYSWQTFTGIWYMFGTPVAAFYLNISGLFLSFIVLFTILSDLIKSVDKSKKTFLNLPIILSSIFIAIPMVWFQSTKDMKLDEWLFFITIIALFFLYKYFSLIREKKNISYLYLFIIWIIVWFSFSIKFTALLLVVSFIAVISFARLGVLWFISYLSLFLWIFTIWNFWSMMNVVINPNSIPWFEKIFGSITILIWLILLTYSFIKNKNIWKIYLKEVSLFLLWFFVVLTPWFAKNISEVFPNVSLWTILSWKTQDFFPDYKKIYNEEELQKIVDSKNIERKKENAITTNEDLLRYFWYEKGILDFVYMPWNLTMQKNQVWEYTNIWFLFLALIPIIFVFLPFRKKYYYLLFIFISAFQILSYFQSDSKIINNSNFASVSTWSINWIFLNNKYVFQNVKNADDIYDISIYDYIDDDVIYSSLSEEDLKSKTKQHINDLVSQLSKKEIDSLPNSQKTQDNIQKIGAKYLENISANFENYYKEIRKNEFLSLKRNLEELFYIELKNKVIDPSIWDKISFLSVPLNENHFNFIKNLNNIYQNSSLFAVWDIVTLNQKLIKNNSSQKEIEIINKIWSENRSLNWFIIDFFAKINLPYWYSLIFLGFLIPTLYLLFTLKDWKLNYIFKLNIVFSSLYVFLWLISSFWIVWYWITMYFGFLLSIWISAFFIVSYKENIDENTYLFKLLSSIIFLSIVIIYFINSLIPYTFNNLKSASYEQFKTWEVTQAEAIFAYHNDYRNVLFTLNIDPLKKKEFLESVISSDILWVVNKIENRTLDEIFYILNDLSSKPEFARSANKSIQNLYKNIQNPNDEFKNKGKIYRVWTFLKYYITENNNRLFEDSLLFSFNDYFYNEDTSITIDRFSKLWFKYLLVDLNAATIDQSETKDLTNRYEKILKTFTSDKISLIETDNICLKIAIENYNQNRDLDQYMMLAWNNYDSYKNWVKISRQEKKLYCIDFIDNLLTNNSITNEKYTYLMPYKNYFQSNPKTKEQINSLIQSSYKVLFQIK